MKLDVYVNGVLRGALEQVDQTKYAFSYQADADPDEMVSLLMPVRTESWSHRFLHPVFQVSLPEGSLRQLLTKNFAKQFDRFGDTELLALVGSHLVGRIQVAAHGSVLSLDSPQESLQDLLKSSSKEMLDHYLGEHAKYSGVSGGFPKFLAKSPVGAGPDSGDKNTLTFDKWIIKANDDDHPDLILNEYFGLKVAKAAGLPTPEFFISQDNERLAIQRFDVLANGKHLGFEDMCALMGLNASDKFSASIERIVKTINDFCQGELRRSSLDQFYSQYAACMAIRNGDAHLKNFGLVYTDWANVRMAPVYDMLTMSAYAPRSQNNNNDTMDEPALTFGGVRRWPTEKTLKSLADRCLVSASQRALAAERLCAAMQSVAQEVVEKAQEVESFGPMAKRMLELWSHGVRLHSEVAAANIADMAQGITISQEVLERSEESSAPSRSQQFAMRQRGG